jgi:beta-lactamase regulating signal transducer with metallopeptidase domain
MNPILEIATRVQAFGPAGPAILLIVKATLVLLIARLMLLAVPRASAATKHLAVTIALCAVIALPILSLAIPAWRLPVLPTAQAAQETDRPKGIGSTGDDQEGVSALDTAVTVAKAAGVVPEDKLTRVSAFFNTVRNSWQGLVVLAIGGVSLLLLLRMAIGIIGVWSVVRRSISVTDDAALRELDAARGYVGLHRRVRLLRSTSVSVPVVWGLFKPVLLLPASSADWTRERLRVVLLHELAHVKRLDGVTLIITKAAVAVFWFHPLAWSLERLSRAECERACDDLVLASGTKASDYAEHLLQIARALPEADPFRSVTLAMTRRSQLEGRLLSILHPQLSRSSFSARAVSMASTAALILIIPLAAVRLVAAPGEGTSQNTPTPEGIVEIGPSVASNVANTPDMILAQFDKVKNDKKSRSYHDGDWYSRGMEHHRDDEYREAIAAFQKSIDEGEREEASTYNIACGYALLGDQPNALRYLRKAIEMGFDVDHAMEDSDLDSIRGSAEFKQLMGERGQIITQANLRKYEALRAAGNNVDGDDWFKVGNELLSLRLLDPAIDSYQRAIKLMEHNSTAMYNLACAYSIKGNTAAGLEWLQKAIENGFDSEERLENDSDLNNIRGNARFAQLVDLADDLRLKSGGFHFKGKGKSWSFGDFADFAGETSWRKNLPRYQEATRKYPNLGRTWFNLGYAQLQADDSAGSVASFRRSAELGYRPATSMYNAACGLARAGQTDAAFEYLQKARAAGFKLYEYLDDDDDLESLHGDPRFLALRKEVRAEHRAEKSKHKVDFDNVF